jgi:CRISPR-associated endoribonuclease Cas6
MTYMNGSELENNGVYLVLQTVNTTPSTSLLDWLPADEYSLTFIPLTNTQGVTKIFVALPKPELYPQLMQVILAQIGKDRIVEWLGKAYIITGVEINHDSLHILQITLQGDEIKYEGFNRAIHALCFHWLALADKDLAETLHGKENVPITLALKPLKSKQQLYLRIGVLQKDILAPLLWGLSQDLGEVITLADVPYRLGKSVEIVKSFNFQDLLNIPAQQEISLQFISPTSFKQSQIIQPFPLPELVFNSLLRRWNAFAPDTLKLPAMEWQGMTTACEIRTKTLKIKANHEIGSIGWVRYRFPVEQAQIATTLAYFAEFAGVGRKTAMGMGQVRLV